MEMKEIGILFVLVIMFYMPLLPWVFDLLKEFKEAREVKSEIEKFEKKIEIDFLREVYRSCKSEWELRFVAREIGKREEWLKCLR